MDIQVMVNDLENAGKLYKNKSEEFVEQLEKLSASMQYILDNSEGEFKVTAVATNNAIRKYVGVAIERLKVLGNWCIETANAFDEADRNAAKKAQI